MAMNIRIEEAFTSEATHQRVLMPNYHQYTISQGTQIPRLRRPRWARTELDAVLMHVLFGRGRGWTVMNSDEYGPA